MGSLAELRAVRQLIYLQRLAETGSVLAATQAANIHISLPSQWRRRYAAFAKAERRAKKQAAKRLMQVHASPPKI